MRVRPRGKRTRVTVEKRGGADGVCEHRGTDDSRTSIFAFHPRERGRGGETGDGGGSRGGTRKGARRKTKERIDDGGGGGGGKEK